MPQFVGIGSINIDLIVAADQARAVDLGDRRLGLRPTDVGGEREITPAESRRALDYLAGFDPIVSPGGSALNVGAAVAGTGAPVSVGHVGVCGTEGPHGFSFPDWFETQGIDTSHVQMVAGPPGLCLAITKGSNRTLLTTGGVNDRLGHLLRSRAAAITDYLGGAAVVHVTSLAGLDDLDPLLALLDTLARRGSRPWLSVDPGAIWTSPTRPAAADEILGRARLVLVNQREWATLADGPDQVGAAFEGLPAARMVVVKGSEAVTVHRRRASGGHTSQVFANPWVLDPDEIIDDTGAGDAFAAGFLLRFAIEGGSVDAGVSLGMDLARAKLRFPGMSRPERFHVEYRRHPR